MGSTDTTAEDPNEWMLTTEDNPFDPFEQFDEWYQWDERSGYHTSSLLARLTFTSEDLSDYQQERAYDQAIDEVVSLNASGVHKKVSRKRIS